MYKDFINELKTKNVRGVYLHGFGVVSVENITEYIFYVYLADDYQKELKSRL